MPQSEIYINSPEDGYEVEVNDTIDLSPKITYDYGSTYTWKLDGDVVSSEKELRLTPTILQAYNYEFTVSNDRGTSSIDIFVQSMYNNNLEDLVLEKDTFEAASTGTSFISDKLIFQADGDPLLESFSGFVYSNLAGNQTEGIKEIYGAYKANTLYESSVFCVMRQGNLHQPVVIETADGENHLFKSLMVNNTYYNYAVIRQGTDNSKNFGGLDGTDPDWFKLTITGFNKEGTQRGTIVFNLADYTAVSNKDSYIISEWTKVNLSSIGKVSRLEFRLSSTDVENDVMRTPPYVCLDEIKIIE